MRMPTLVRATPPHSLLGALLVVLAVVLTVPLGDGDRAARTLVVDASDPTAFATITEAVAAAHDGDRVLVRPGRYVESVVLDKAVSIEGDGDRAAIIVEVQDLAAIHVLADGAAFGILVTDAATPTVTGNDIHDNEWGIGVGDSATPTITDNTIIEDFGGISVLDSATPTILGMSIVQNQGGILVGNSATPTISENEVYENERFDIRIVDGATATIDGREVTGPHSE